MPNYVRPRKHQSHQQTHIYYALPRADSALQAINERINCAHITRYIICICVYLRSLWANRVATFMAREKISNRAAPDMVPDDVRVSERALNAYEMRHPYKEELTTHFIAHI